MKVRAVLLASALGCAAACQKERDAAPSDDRTLAKLKAEVDRMGPHGAADEGSPHPKLKALVSGPTPTKELLGARKLPAANATVHLGSLAVKLVAVEVDHTVRAGAVALTSEDVFVHLRLMAQNVGAKPAAADFAFALLSDKAGKTFALASDAQRLAGTRELQAALPPGEPRELNLYFEAPLEAVDKGLALVFPPAVGGPPSPDGDVRIALD